MDEARREYRRKPQDNPVDYALFLNSTESLFIEAKLLDKDLNDRKWISQNLSYATVVGVRWCVLTNGDEYRIYNSHAAVEVERKLFRSVCISDTADANYATDTLHLLSKEQMQGRLPDELWKVHFIDGNVSCSLESLLANEDSGLIRLLRKKAKGITPAKVRASLKRAKILIDFLVPAFVGGMQPPSSVAREIDQGDEGSGWALKEEVDHSTLDDRPADVTFLSSAVGLGADRQITPAERRP